MPWVHHHGNRQGVEPPNDALIDGILVAPGQVSAPDGTAEEGVAREDALRSADETDAARRVPRRVDHPQPHITHDDLFPFLEGAVWMLEGLRQRVAEHRAWHSCLPLV